MTEKKTVWQSLKNVNIEKMVEEKNKLKYISWAMAWSALCDNYPDATFEKHINDQGFPYFKDNNGYCFTKVTVTVGSKSLTELLPVLNYANKPIKDPNSFEVNTSLQRCFAKAIALHGMGVTVYSGEDLPDAQPEVDQVNQNIKDKQAEKTVEQQQTKEPNKRDQLSAWANEMHDTPDTEKTYSKEALFAEQKERLIKGLDQAKSLSHLTRWKMNETVWIKKFKTDSPEDYQDLIAYYGVRKTQIEATNDAVIDNTEEIPT